jgi:hypothetical protein
MEENRSIFVSHLQTDVKYWDEVAQHMAKGSPVQVDDEGNLTQPSLVQSLTQSLVFGWGTQKSSSEMLQLFEKKVFASRQQTIEDIKKTKELANHVSYDKDQKGYAKALEALSTLEEGINTSLQSIGPLKDHEEYKDQSEQQALSNLKLHLTFLQTNIQTLKSDLLKMEEDSEEAQFQLMSANLLEDSDLGLDEFTTIYRDYNELIPTTTDEEALKEEVRSIIITHQKDVVSELKFKDGSIQVPACFSLDVKRNRSLKFNGVGYINHPKNSGLAPVSDERAEQIYREMISSLGETGAFRLAYLLQQELLSGFGAIKEFENRFPAGLTSPYIEVKADKDRVIITAKLIVKPQFDNDPIYGSTPITGDGKEFVLIKKTVVIPLSDLNADDFDTNPLPNVHVIEQVSPILDSYDHAAEVLLEQYKGSEKRDDEALKQEVVGIVKESKNSLPREIGQTHVFAPSTMLVELHRLWELRINGEHYLSAKNPFQNQETSLADHEIIPYQLSTYKHLTELLGEEGVKRAAPLLVDPSILTSCLTDIKSHWADFGISDEARFIPVGVGALYVDLEIDGQNLKIVQKGVIALRFLNEDNEPKSHACVIGKMEITIPLEELQAADFYDKDNPIPGLHVIQSFSNRVDVNDQSQVIDLLHRF